EVMFDVTQVPARYGLKRTKLAPVPSQMLVESDIVAANVQRIWQQWKAAKLPNYGLSRVPIIRQPEPLQAATSPQMYRMLTALIDGKRTLWEIVVKTQREVVQIVKPLHPFITAGWIELAERPSNTVPASPPSSPRVGHKPNASPTVACVDDSLMVCQALEKIVRSSGYGFTGIVEPSRAIATLLTRKPSIIFLDLIMPETNGYEICAQLRKTTQFKETPIVILTGNDGVVDQVRARLIGATDFISKPVDPTIISNIIRKYMPDNLHSE
ncbi:MAG: response regulator, partial [Elainellaceae cyanobacterium]